jgi:hypothetical protein
MTALTLPPSQKAKRRGGGSSETTKLSQSPETLISNEMLGESRNIYLQNPSYI